MPTAHVNDVDMYHEVRGSGPSVLFISGATGDAGHFEKVAELLSNEFTAVTYDRRGSAVARHPSGRRGHAPYLDRPEDVAKEIRPFLRQVS